MEEAAASMYGVHYYPTPPPIAFSADCGAGDDLHALISRMPPPAASSHDRLKAQIASHPRYPLLLDAYIGCQKVHPSIPTVQFPSAKVGAPPEVSTLLDEIRRENDLPRRSPPSLAAPDPELDFFMEAYCDVLARYRTDLARPFDEATAFLNDMEEKLTGLCGARSNAPEDCAGSSDDDLSSGELDVRDAQIKGEDKDLKDKLLRKYSGYLSSLKQEFSKKKKKGKLPKEARQALLDWWNIHYKWPYPTEADKIALAELTGLDQKQINNWFINQRKRHWKPSESMQIAVMDSLNTPYYLDG